jgi:hypothetical protein
MSLLSVCGPGHPEGYPARLSRSLPSSEIHVVGLGIVYVLPQRAPHSLVNVGLQLASLLRYLPGERGPCLPLFERWRVQKSLRLVASQRLKR